MLALASLEEERAARIAEAAEAKNQRVIRTLERAAEREGERRVISARKAVAAQFKFAK